MPITNTIEGNLITLANEKRYSAVVQGNNCFCVWGAGLAPQMKQRWPKAWNTDMMTKSGDKGKLGTVTHWFDPKLRTFIVNAYTQYSTDGRSRKPPVPDVNYDAIDKVFRRLNNTGYLRRDKRPVGIPLIGAGLAGGDWEIIKRIIDNATPDIEIELVKYNGG